MKIIKTTRTKANEDVNHLIDLFNKDYSDAYDINSSFDYIMISDKRFLFYKFVLLTYHDKNNISVYQFNGKIPDVQKEMIRCFEKATGRKVKVYL